jgi:hypothetical protein
VVKEKQENALAGPIAAAVPVPIPKQPIDAGHLYPGSANVFPAGCYSVDDRSTVFRDGSHN